MRASKRGVLIAAPASGCGKTTITLGLLRALKNRGVDVAAAKSGPDYIDPAFHQAAVGRTSVNLDAFAMRGTRLRQLANRAQGELLIVEGAMGLFDGSVDGAGTSADVAAALGIPVILVMDVRRQGQTAAALAQGLAKFRDDVTIAGVILNSVGSARHERMLRKAFDNCSIDVLGALPRQSEIGLPSRHLGLVQAYEIEGLDQKLENLASLVCEHVDIDRLIDLAKPISSSDAENGLFPALGRQIAIARDTAFSFLYPHMLDDWRLGGSDLSFFSPLNDEAPNAQADAVFLPGGYPELHTAKLSTNRHFYEGMHRAAKQGASIFGECGGFMTLGDGLIDSDGQFHRMLGLLPLVTSFEKRQRHLGYRHVQAIDGKNWVGHEFHYTTTLSQSEVAPLFRARASGEDEVLDVGLVRGNVSGSFIHLIDPVA